MRCTGKRVGWPTTEIDTTGWGVKTYSEAMGKTSFSAKTAVCQRARPAAPGNGPRRRARLCLPDDEAAQLFPIFRLLPRAHRAQSQGARLRIRPRAHRARGSQDRAVRRHFAG